MKQYDIKDEAEVETKPIEDYWEKVIINSRYFTITEKDKKILKYLTNVKYIKYPESLNDFRVDFYFDKTGKILSETQVMNILFDSFDFYMYETLAEPWHSTETQELYKGIWNIVVLNKYGVK
jgi:hypothetical protein